MYRLVDHAFILATVLFTVYSQLIIRWQVSHAGPLPQDLGAKAVYVLNLLFSPWIMSAILATFGAGVSWMLAMTKFEIGYAYPFVSLTYVFVMAGSVVLFHEELTVSKLVGTAVVLLGLFILVRG